MSKRIPLEVVPTDHSIIKFGTPLLIPVEILDKGTPQQCYFVELKEIGVSAVGVDIEELYSCLHSDIRMTWKRVCHKPKRTLTPEDKEIRRQFRKLAEEINIGDPTA